MIDFCKDEMSNPSTKDVRSTVERDPQSPIDRELESRVRLALAAANLPALRRLDVRARSGVVTLAGRVTSFYEKQVSHCNCRHVTGVIRLVDAVDVVTSPRSPALA